MEHDVFIHDTWTMRDPATVPSPMAGKCVAEASAAAGTGVATMGTPNPDRDYRRRSEQWLRR